MHPHGKKQNGDCSTKVSTSLGNTTHSNEIPEAYNKNFVKTLAALEHKKTVSTLKFIREINTIDRNKFLYTQV